MDSNRAKALLANLSQLKLKPGARQAFAVYLRSIIDSELGRDTQSIIGRLPLSQQVNINDTTQAVSQFNEGLIARAGDRLTAIPDSLFDNPANELEAGNTSEQ